MPEDVATAVVQENEKSRLDALRASMAVLALLALIALFTSQGIPTRQPGKEAVEASRGRRSGPGDEESP